MAQIPTVRIVSPGGYVVINESEFDPKVHERYFDKPSSDPIVMAGESFVVDPSGAVKANSVTITDTVKGHKPRGRPKK